MPNTHALIPWESIYDVWQTFVDDYPQLGLSHTSDKAAANFARNFKEPLLASGALAKAHNGRWLAHRDFFPVAACAIWLRLDPVAAVAEAREKMSPEREESARAMA